MILGFKKEFVPPIMAGTKIHTIRRDEPNRWRSGVNIQMATGAQTKNYNCFKEEVCRSTQRIFMSYDWMLHVSVGGHELDNNEKEILAINDGFASFKLFENWFYPDVIKGEYQSYAGKIIHWTDLRYEDSW